MPDSSPGQYTGSLISAGSTCGILAGAFAYGVYDSRDSQRRPGQGRRAASKTLLLESLLLVPGRVRNKVCNKNYAAWHDGTTVSDFDEQERRLQHSLDSAICGFDHGKTHVNIIDTPGYPDYSGHRTLSDPGSSRNRGRGRERRRAVSMQSPSGSWSSRRSASCAGW